MDEIKEIERSIIKKYRKEIWSKFVKGVKDFEMIKENDKIAVLLVGEKILFYLLNVCKNYSVMVNFIMNLNLLL